MYGGDEVSAIVIDLGYHTCKAGYAGEDAPKAVFPSVVGSIEQQEVVNGTKFEKESESMSDLKGGLKGLDSEKAKTKRKLYVGSQALGFRRDHMEVISPFQDGVVADWDIVDNIWAHAFKERLLIDPKEHPMLLAEPTSNAPQQRERSSFSSGITLCSMLCMAKVVYNNLSSDLAVARALCSRMAEILFENYKVPALFVAKNAVLTSFASGRATSLVVDR
ncbi:hypothetical protein M5K25_009954 [Dendrobium thyrsiflorum]|uniref:Actin-related protein 4 n=1 Tax=Dendrobium thyrsiflorum TaxID=117978 RepID=A0ABD0VDS5_DENTH